MPTLWDNARARLRPQAAKNTWELGTIKAATTIRKALGIATKEYDRARTTRRAEIREKTRRLGKAGRIFREIMGARRANGKEIMTIGEGAEKELFYTAETVHRASSNHFNKHFGAGRKK